MRMRSYRGFFGTASRRRIDCQDEQQAPKPRTFTPSQQLAMLILRKSELSMAVVDKLSRSTVKAGEVDFVFLETERLAVHNGVRRELTPMGRFLADQAARELGMTFGVAVLRTTTLQPGGSFQRKWHTNSWTQ